MKKIIALTMSVFMLLTLFAGCSGNNTPSSASGESSAASSASSTAVLEGNTATVGEAEEGRTVTTTGSNPAERYPKVAFALNNDVTTLEPWLKYSGSKRYVFTLMYEQLFDFVNNDYVPSLAKGFTVIDDLHYEVEIYDYIYDWEGNNITADDVIACYDRYIEGGYTTKFDTFGSIEKVDDYKLLFTWTKAIDSIGELEHIWCLVQIYSQTAWDNHNFATDPIGTGPYKVTSFTSGSTTILEAYDNYWQTDDSLIEPWHYRNVQTVEFPIISESAQQTIGLQTGTLDFSPTITADDVVYFEDGGEYADAFSVANVLKNGSWYVAPNHYQGITTDANFRLACWYALDNNVIAKAASAAPCTGFGSSINTDYVDEWETWETYQNTMDLQLAKEYLAKTNYNGETLNLAVKNTTVGKNAAVMMQTMLLQIGVNVEINSYDATFFESLATAYDQWDFYMIDVGGSVLIGCMNRILNNKDYGNGRSSGGLQDDKLQELLMTAAALETHTDENMSALYQYILDNGHYYYICTELNRIVYTDKVAELYLLTGIYATPNACTYYLD